MHATSTTAFAVALTLSSFTIAEAQTPSYDWTGIYFGTHIGTTALGNGWKSDATGNPQTQPFPDSFTSGGVIKGIQAGYNYQFGNRVVVGLEADLSAADIEGGARCARGMFYCETQVLAMGTFSARAGYSFDNFLVYLKGGTGWMRERISLTPSPGNGITAIAQGKATRWGAMVGAGLEYAFAPNLSARIEYNYYNFNGGAVTATDQDGDQGRFWLRQEMHVVKLGLNYQLGRVNTQVAGWPSVGGTPTHDWTGVYVGVHGGGSFGTTSWKSADGPLAAASSSTFNGNGSMDGMIGGGQIGYNKQFGSIVAGVEADFSVGNLDGFSKCATTEGATPGTSASFTCHSHINYLVTGTGRLGVTFGNLLLYSKAGVAWANEKHDAYRSDITNVFAGRSMRTGYVLGSGAEYAFTPAWSGRFEYRYMDFGTRNIALTDQGGLVSNVSMAQRNHVAMFGLNYKLGVDSAASSMAYAPFKVRAAPSDWTMEVGTRYFYSNGKSQLDLYDSTRTNLVNSRLIYGGMTGHSLEGFTRFQHRSGLFVKGNFGMGSLVNGTLNDEDQPPNTNPYSNTSHTMSNGSLRYGSADIGYNVIQGPSGSVGPFVGYRYLYQLGRGYGCVQIAQGNICTPSVPNYILGLTETEQYRGIAFGLNTKMAMTNRVTMEFDAAFIPFADRAGVDNHWLRADINPGPENGRAWGVQVEGIVSYAMTSRWSIGLGGRYWYFATTNGAAVFPNIPDPSPTKFHTARYGAFFQTSYKFGGNATEVEPETLPAANWTGIYAGGRFGAGYGRSNWADPYPKPPSGNYTMMGGVLGGVQVGANMQMGQWVVGGELSANLAQLEGSNTCFGGNPNVAIAAQECENRTSGLGLLTARLGYAYGRSLFYGSAGGALGREVYTLNTGAAGGPIDVQRAWNVGWTLGGGIEHALTDRWSVAADYKFIDFGSRTVNFNVPAAIPEVANTSIRSQRQLVTLGLNYKFGQR